MLKKKYSEDGKTCRVTFKLPSAVNAETVHLWGDFTQWDKAPKKMTRNANGSFSIGLTLPAGQTYRYRFLLDGNRWENDWEAEGYLANPFGTEDSILKT